MVRELPVKKILQRLADIHLLAETDLDELDHRRVVGFATGYCPIRHLQIEVFGKP
jgi:hypothetical protein